jgi:hypothetical protein
MTNPLKQFSSARPHKTETGTIKSQAVTNLCLGDHFPHNSIRGILQAFNVYLKRRSLVRTTEKELPFLVVLTGSPRCLRLYR